MTARDDATAGLKARFDTGSITALKEYMRDWLGWDDGSGGLIGNDELALRLVDGLWVRQVRQRMSDQLAAVPPSNAKPAELRTYVDQTVEALRTELGA